MISTPIVSVRYLPLCRRPPRPSIVRIQRRHTAGAGRGDGLAIDMVGHIARCEYARNARGRRAAVGAGTYSQIAVSHFKLVFE